jgi:hypothetical protein
MREQAYPSVNRDDTAPGQPLGEMSYLRVAAQPAHISTRVTRIATLRGWVLNTLNTDADGRVQRQCSGYVKLGPISYWDERRIACAVTPTSKQHDAMTTHTEITGVFAGFAPPDSCVPYGEIGDGDPATPAVRDIPFSAPRPIAAASSTLPDVYQSIFYGWVTREYGCMNLATADLLDCTTMQQRSTAGRTPADWPLTSQGAEPTQIEPRCAAVRAQWYPRPASSTNAALSLVRVASCSYAAEP